VSKIKTKGGKGIMGGTVRSTEIQKKSIKDVKEDSRKKNPKSERGEGAKEKKGGDSKKSEVGRWGGWLGNTSTYSKGKSG